MEIKWITVDEIARKANFVRGMAGDPEAAHDAEDRLHQKVLREIAMGHPQAQQVASEVIKTLDIDFPRWCA